MVVVANGTWYSAFMFWFKWLGTGVCLVGMALTSLNIFPLNLWVTAASCIPYAVDAYLRKDWQLETIEVVIFCMCIFGIGKTLL